MIARAATAGIAVVAAFRIHPSGLEFAGRIIPGKQTAQHGDAIGIDRRAHYKAACTVKHNLKLIRSYGNAIRNKHRGREMVAGNIRDGADNGQHHPMHVVAHKEKHMHTAPVASDFP